MKRPPCTKRRYDTETHAVAAAKAAERKGTLPLNAYRCRTCRTTKGKRYWHIGHRAPRYLRLGMGRRP